MNFPDPKEYRKMSAACAPRSPILRNSVFAFLIGGGICALGQAFSELFLMQGLSKDVAVPLSSVTLVFLSALFTGIGIYDDLAVRAGAGTLVPITGFANAIASPAVEFKTEGLVMGLGAKMFIIAGPVLVYGVSASVLYGIIYWLFGVITGVRA